MFFIYFILVTSSNTSQFQEVFHTFTLFNISLASDLQFSARLYYSLSFSFILTVQHTCIWSNFANQCSKTLPSLSITRSCPCKGSSPEQRRAIKRPSITRGNEKQVPRQSVTVSQVITYYSILSLIILYSSPEFLQLVFNNSLGKRLIILISYFL